MQPLDPLWLYNEHVDSLRDAAVEGYEEAKRGTEHLERMHAQDRVKHVRDVASKHAVALTEDQVYAISVLLSE